MRSATAVPPLESEPGVWIAALLILCGVLASLWDLYCFVSPECHQTVSETINRWGSQWPPLLIALGVLIGHLFWPLRRQ